MRVGSTMLVRQNLTRKLSRSILLVICIGIAFFVFGVLSSFRAGFEGSEANSERLVVASKIGGNETLPLRYFQQLGGMDEIAEVTHVTRLRAHTAGNERNIIGANAVDAQSYASVYADTYDFNAEIMQAFQADRTATLVGRQLAEREGWAVGDRVNLTSFVHMTQDASRDWSFVIAGLLDGAEPTVDTNFLIVRYDYFNAALLRNQDQVNLFGIKPAVGTDINVLAETIDMTFANSTAQTRTQSETAFMSAFLEQFADVALIVKLIVSVSFGTILLIVANTMIFAIRERTLEIGVLKVLGFSGSSIMRIILTETLVLFAAGLALGFALTAAVIPVLGDALSSVVPDLYLTPKVVATSVGLAVVFAVLTGFLPAIKALRLPVATALNHR
ncbi:putative ABC transport system permease protein [Yoonia maritima]|uniref:Putative ABC transport system permease protein n=1 Tax=Yoonia maritima TaxID=1435347 RepID=A0A2T0VXB7_9RHOB|nr:ABC transporter permease [Yoonia maritima]PRY76672.1 putative ABC transport system permease protein [Yoonia maritima]